MKNFFYLKTCSTCQKILKELNLREDIELREIKSQPLTLSELERLANKTGSYEAIFSRKARKYQELNLKNQRLTEADFKELLLGDYTFLKRPVLEMGKHVISGNTRESIDRMREHL
jgi:arsenate reductase